MKKLLILASLIAFSMTSVLAAENTVETDKVKKEPVAQTEVKPEKPDYQKAKPKSDFKRAKFEDRLNLTEEQKIKINELRVKGHEQMKPIMEQVKAKKQEAEAIKRSRMAAEMQEEKLNEIRADLKELQKQAHELRMQDMKDFGSILTKKQRKELEKIKKEGRQRFEKEHKRPPMGPKPGEDRGPRPHHPEPIAE